MGRDGVERPGWMMIRLAIIKMVIEMMMVVMVRTLARRRPIAFGEIERAAVAAAARWRC